MQSQDNEKLQKVFSGVKSILEQRFPFNKEQEQEFNDIKEEVFKLLADLTVKAEMLEEKYKELKLRINKFFDNIGNSLYIDSQYLALMFNLETLFDKEIDKRYIAEERMSNEKTSLTVLEKYINYLREVASRGFKASAIYKTSLDFPATLELLLRCLEISFQKRERDIKNQNTLIEKLEERVSELENKLREK